MHLIAKTHEQGPIERLFLDHLELAAGRDPTLGEEPQHLRVRVRHAGERPTRARLEGLQAHRVALVDLQVAGRDRIAVGVAGGIAEPGGDQLLEFFGQDVLEHLRLLVHAVPGDAKALGEVELEQAVMAQNLERDPPAIFGQRDAVIRLMLDEPELMGLLAPILCAGVTTYKGLKETEARPGEWVAISGIGGLGHVAVQYAKAMGLHVVALDVTEDKLTLARSLGADVAVNARAPDAVEQVLKATSGGAHGVLVTAVSPPAFSQALHLARRKGTVALCGLPPGEFPTPIFDVVLKRITIRGSIVGTRKDLAEALAFAAEGKVRAHIHQARLEDINNIFADLKEGKVDGRMVVTM